MKIRGKLVYLTCSLFMVLMLVPANVHASMVSLNLSDIVVDSRDNTDMTVTNTDVTDENGDGYHDGDVAIIQNIISKSSTLSQKCDLEDISTWDDYVIWDGEGRIRLLWIDTISDYVGELDVSGLENIDTVICANNPGLTSLKLPDNGLINYINSSGTGVAKLDVTGYPELVCLYCDDTNISVIDVSNNPKLEDLTLDNTKIISIDVSKNPNLEVFTCNNTAITELDVSNNLLLENFQYPEEQLKKLTVKGGYGFIIEQTEGGKVKLVRYDMETGHVIISAQPGEGYATEGWNGLPENAVLSEDKAEFDVTGNVTVSANFVVIPEKEDTIQGSSGSENSEDIDATAETEKETKATVKSPKTGDQIPVWYTAIWMMIALGASTFIVKKWNKESLK